MSTTFMNQERAIQRCIDAVSAMPVRALVTVGPTLEPTSFRSPNNVAVVRSAPHTQVFEQTTAVVTHGGMGTVSRALAGGLPLVCMPMGRDQSDIAARVQWHGAGLRVRRRASASDLKETIQRVLGDESFRHAAKRLRDEIEADVKANRAVAEVEALAIANDRRVP
jgi:MGT family glycosyltransferase